MNTALPPPPTKATHAIALPESGNLPPEWVQVLPAGIFAGRDGRGPYTADVEAVVAATMRYLAGAELPLDYDHQTEHTVENGQPAPASGWVKELQGRAEGGLWARVAWTPKAAAAIVAREYRYLSPVFFHSKAGEVLRLDSIALTNKPNLQLKALSNQQTPTTENPMTLKESLAKLFGLPTTAEDAAIVAHATQVMADAENTKAAHTQANADLATLRTGLATALHTQGDDATLLKSAQAATVAAKAIAPDPAKYISIEAHSALAAELGAFKAAQAAQAANALVDEAKKAGKVSPAMEPWAKDYACQNPAGFKAYMATAPVIAAVSGSPAAHNALGTPPAGAVTLDDMEKSVCAAMGLPEEDFVKAKQAAAAGQGA